LAVLTVRVTPRAGRTAFAGIRDGVLQVKLAAAPVEGAANDSRIELLSDTLGIPKRSIRIATGVRSRTKTVEISGLSEEQARTLLSGVRRC
jgi:uncharacterized protein YggU (UPF0235/DUF167 family)